jgi:hypothetical protein
VVSSEFRVGPIERRVSGSLRFLDPDDEAASATDSGPSLASN